MSKDIISKGTDSSCDSQSALKDRVISFIWQHLMLIVSLFVMTFGVALCVRSNFGSSVISAIPLAMTLAGDSAQAPRLSIGEYTYLMNVVLVAIQILVLRRRFEAVQLFQLLIGFFFGFLLDVNMWLTQSVVCDTLWSKILTQLAGCLVLGVGISVEIRCGSVTMPGEGVPAAISKATGVAFAKAKIIVDICLVAGAVALCYAFFGRWLWNVVGPGTLFAMVFVGMVVRFCDSRMGWVDRILDYTPALPRSLYGLARYIYHR